MSPGTNFPSRSPSWMQASTEMSDVRIIATTVLVLAIVGLVAVVAYGVWQRMSDRARRRTFH